MPPPAESASDPATPRGLDCVAVADDLTGSLEVAAAFAEHGLPAQVGGEPEATDLVHVSDWESRHLGADLQARVPSASLARLVAHHRPRWILHKMDSTLRGNWARESLLVARSSGRHRVVVVPAYPRMGRICREGCVFVDGVPVHETAAGRDPIDPVTCSDVAQRLEQAGYEMVTTCEDHRELADRLSDGQGGAEVVDCASQSELAAIVTALLPYADDLVLSGTGALAHAVAAAIGGAPRVPAVPEAGWLVVCGSLAERSRDQVAALDLPTVTVGGESTERDLAAALAAAERLAAGESLVLTTPVLTTGARGDTALAAALATVASAVRERVGFRHCCVLGGDTARALTRSADRIRPLGEVSPGVPLSEVASADGSWWMLSKAGAFGDTDLITRLIRPRRGRSTISRERD